jgi:hypothetical protein
MHRRTPAAKVRIAVFLSGHGFGHLVRTATILTALSRRRPLDLRVFTGAPGYLWPDSLRAITSEWVSIACDVGVVEETDARVDRGRTIAALQAWLENRDRHLDELDRCLDRGHDMIVSDVPPEPLALAADRGIPAIAVANFSWDWIYRELGMQHAADHAATSYARASLLVELTPSAPMPAFPRRRVVGTVGRVSSRSRREVREALGVAESTRLVALALRSTSLTEIRLPTAGRDLAFVAPRPPTELVRQGCLSTRDAVEFIDLVVASDFVVAKPGYGIIGDCAANGRALLWVPREGFPEDRVLEPWLQLQPWAQRIERQDLSTGAWDTALTRVVPGSHPTDATGVTSAAAAVSAACDAVEETLR